MRTRTIDEAAAVHKHHHCQAACAESALVQMFMVKQSALKFGARVGGPGFCMQSAPKFIDFRTPSHGVGGAGGFHRNSSTGGAA
jgi:hypothetical protein